MRALSRVVIGLIAALHLYIAWFEIFAWTSRGPRVFPTLPPELFEPTVAMAANQGVYNAFLAAGLLWSLFVADPRWRDRIALCFLGFVAVAGIAGAVTIAPRILLVQTVPALVGMVLVVLAGRRDGRDRGVRTLS